MQSQLTAKAEPLACRYCSAELYSIPHIISRSFYGPCHHASRSINALSPTAVCLFTPKSHPSNKFHPSPLRSPPPLTRGPNSCSPNITCPLWERRRRRGEKEGTKGRGKVIQTEREHPSFSPPFTFAPRLSWVCVCYTAAGFPREIGGRYIRIAWLRNSLNLCPFLHTCSASSPFSLFRLPSILGWSGKRRRSGVKLVALPGWRWRGGTADRGCRLRRRSWRFRVSGRVA